jgi:hypothetical protein
MEIDVGFHPEAREEYLDTIAWYLTHSAVIARGFQHEFVRRIAIQNNPDDRRL